MKTWVYVFVRTDLPLHQQMVQSNHASLEAGHTFERKSKYPSSLVMLAVPDHKALMEAYIDIRQKGLRCEMFFEPDWDYGNTAFASEPVTMEQRKLFSEYKLWRAPV